MNKDRLIPDRRPLLAVEARAGPVRLPYALKLCNVTLEDGRKIWMGKRDPSYAFVYQFVAEDSGLYRQIL